MLAGQFLVKQSSTYPIKTTDAPSYVGSCMCVLIYTQIHAPTHTMKRTTAHRSVWDSEGNKPTDCRRGLLEPVTLCLKMERNLSTHWYHGMPTVSVDAQLEPLQVHTCKWVPIYALKMNSVHACMYCMYMYVCVHVYPFSMYKKD